MIVAAVEADGAIGNVNAVTPQPPAQGQKSSRRVAKNARLATIVFVELHIAQPEQGLRRALARMLALVQPGMNVEGIIVFIIKRHTPEEIQMLGRNTAGNHAPGLVKFSFSPDYQGAARILFEGSLAARHWSDPDIGSTIDKVEHHLLMIAAQTNNFFGILTTKLDHLIDTARRIEAAVNQIAKKYQGIGGLVSWQHFQQIGELRATTVNVSDNKGFHTS